ncbi:hypothetical protein WCW05_005037 [Escherichia coli]|uniref:hypothetical protein n=2 Tax=Escherichia coli TaxID=562 RepID=UPI000BE4C22A|nr:hypothetical protein [Escherichia coli]MCQ0354890.1 hypothetical protein [Escherichia coli]MCT6427814.1 hypothetical protein [Escherichia coli]HBC9794197.1 hypothetical protein [Escherichia coli]
MWKHRETIIGQTDAITASLISRTMTRIIIFTYDNKGKWKKRNLTVWGRTPSSNSEYPVPQSITEIRIAQKKRYAYKMNFTNSGEYSYSHGKRFRLAFYNSGHTIVIYIGYH